MTLVWYIVYVILGLLALKVIFYDFPGAMKSNNWKEYITNVAIIIVILAVLSGIGYLTGGFDLS